jgi:hypothetical protein
MYHNQGFPNAFAYQNQRRNGEEAAAGNEENNGKSVRSVNSRLLTFVLSFVASGGVGSLPLC